MRPTQHHEEFALAGPLILAVPVAITYIVALIRGRGKGRD